MAWKLVRKSPPQKKQTLVYLKSVQSTLSHLQSPPEQMQFQRNYDSFLSKSYLHGMILLTMLAQRGPNKVKDNALIEQFVISRSSISNRGKQLRYV